MRTTLSGMVKLHTLLLRNAATPMFVTPYGMVTRLR